MNPLISQAIRNGAAMQAPSPAPTSTPSGPDFSPLIAMFAVDATGAPAAQIGGLWAMNDLTKLFQHSNGTGAVTAAAARLGM